MERRRADAVKLLEIAERHFASHDVIGAKRKALRAQGHFPSLPGLRQAIAAYDVHLSAAKKLPSGDTDWYGVLGVDPSTCDRERDAAMIKRRFRRLSLLVHPDKNRSVAAEGAFKLLRQAWEFLSSSSSSHPTSTPGTGPTPTPTPTPASRSSSSASFRRQPSCRHCGVDLGCAFVISDAFIGSFRGNVNCQCPGCGKRTDIALEVSSAAPSGKSP